MLLQRLVEYADRLSLPPPLYAETPIRYIIELDGHGRLLNPRPTDTADPSSPRTRRGQRRLAPQVQRSSGIKALLFADNAEYTLGLAREDSKPQRVAACHAAYLGLVDRCAGDTRDPRVGAVRTFLHNDPVDKLALPEDFDRGATITFRVDGRFVVDLQSVQAFWAAEHDPAKGSAPVMQCLVCGQQRPVLDRLQAKIKGVPGGQSSGTAIISANAPAFESYGLEASLIAPTCAPCGERFTKAANHLLASEANSIRLGGAAFVFWTREDVPFSFRDMLVDPTSGQVKSLLESVKSGRPAHRVDDTAFYATSFSGSGGRVVVRDWIDTTVGEVKTSLARWFELQRIVGLWGEEPQPLGLFPLAAATVREARDLAPPVPRALLRAALTGTPVPRGLLSPPHDADSTRPADLTGTPVPWGLLSQAVRRNQAEQQITRQRAALIKLVLLSQETNVKEGYMVQLDADHPSPAYHCGRLLAVLETVQRLAVPGAKATIVDRFFGTASTAPASVFSRLMRGAQPHLGKLQRDRPGAHSALQQRLEEVCSRIPQFPKTLTLEGQGFFALGYYHQRAHDRAQAREAAARRKAGMPSTPDADLADNQDEQA